MQAEYSRAAQPLVEERILVMRKRMSDGLGSSKQEIEYFIIFYFLKFLLLLGRSELEYAEYGRE